MPILDSEINLITYLASTLMSLGDTEIYSETYEQVVHSICSSGDVEPTWEPPSANVKYHINGSEGRTIRRLSLGPFGEEKIKHLVQGSLLQFDGGESQGQEGRGGMGRLGSYCVLSLIRTLIIQVCAAVSIILLYTHRET